MAKYWEQGDEMTADDLNRTGGFAEIVLPTMTLSEINTILSEAEAEGGGSVVFKNGTYTLDGDLVIPSNIGIIAESFGGVYLAFVGDYGVKASGTLVYEAETVSITKGTTTVTGSGTSFSTNVSVGDKILLDGFYYEITSVDSNTQLTIGRPYNYKTLSGASYIIADTKESVFIDKLYITNASTGVGTGISMEYTEASFISQVVVLGCDTGFSIKNTSVIGMKDILPLLNTNGFHFDNANSLALQEVSGENSTSNFYINNCRRCYINDAGIYTATVGMEIDNCFQLSLNSIWSGDNTTGIEIKDSDEINILSSFVYNSTDGITVDGDCTKVKISNCTFRDNSTNLSDSGTDTLISGNIGVKDKNTEAETPTSDYQVANKKYVDDSFITPNIEVYTSDDTWSKPTGLVYVEVEVVGGGGGGVAERIDSGWDEVDIGGAAGGSGGYSKKIITAGSLGSTESVTVGDGGDGGVADEYDENPTNPANGDSSSFGSHLSATGGSKGVGNFAGGAGGDGSNGDVNIHGDDGTGGFEEKEGPYADTHQGNAEAGVGGGNPLAGRRRGPEQGTNENGYNGYSYGGGGTGGSCDDEKQTAHGGDGADGVVIVKEFF